MRIAEFEITEYGPLKNLKKIKPGNFTLFFGRNENGKTLTIDAIIKFLLGKRIKDFRQADRVTEYPAGFLRIVSQGMGERKLPDDGDLVSLTKNAGLQLTPADCRNIFIIRNSELWLSDEAGFYTGLTDRLVGLRTADINKIRKNLAEIGMLTPGFGFRDDEKSGRLKTRLDKAQKLIEGMERAREKLLEDNYDSLDLDLYRKTRELSCIRDTIKMYEHAENREKYEKSSELLADLERTIASLSGMERYSDKDAELWQNSERELKRISDEAGDLREKGKAVSLEAASLKKEYNELKVDIDIFERKKYELESDRLRLKNLQTLAQETESDTSMRDLLKRVSIFSTIITFAIVASWFFSPTVYLYAAGIISLVINAVLWIYEVVLQFKKRKVSAEFVSVISSLSEKGIKAQSISDAFEFIGKFSSDYDRMQVRLRRLETDIMSAERHLKEIEEKIAEYREAAETHERGILSVRTKSGLASLEEYREMLRLKKKREADRDGIASKLEGMLGIQGGNISEILGKIRIRVKEIEIYRDKAENIRYDQKTCDTLKEKATALEEEIRAIKGKLDPYAAGMADLEVISNELLAEEGERLYCKTLVDLNGLLAKLRGFVRENESRRESVSNAVRILNEIELEEKGRVHELFDAEGPSSVSGIFKNITAGLYDKVIYDTEMESIKTRYNNGEIINAEKLSGGAYDQLYFAIRLAIGEKLLKDEKGFFIMDDPFIKSDMERVKIQINVLKKISEIGWQILYFSCKNEIKDILSKDIENGIVGYFDIKLNH